MDTISETSQKLGYLEDFGGMDIQFQYQLFASYFGNKCYTLFGAADLLICSS